MSEVKQLEDSIEEKFPVCLVKNCGRQAHSEECGMCRGCCRHFGELEGGFHA